jgi:hypothetical protein
MDYPELIAEVTERTGETVAPRASLYVTLAEKQLAKRLRLSERTDTVTTDSDGTADLPDDFGYLRDLVYQGNVIEAVDVTRIGGTYTTGYAIQGTSLLTNYANADLTLHYFAGLPSIVDFLTNWLLEAEPEIYIYAVMQQVFMAKLQVEKAQAAAAVLDGLIADYVRSEILLRLGHSSYRVVGPTP